MDISLPDQRSPNIFATPQSDVNQSDDEIKAICIKFTSFRGVVRRESKQKRKIDETKRETERGNQGLLVKLGELFSGKKVSSRVAFREPCP